MSLGKITLSTNGNHSAGRWRGGTGDMLAHGTFGSATLRLQWSLDETTWNNYVTSGGTSGVLSAAGRKRIILGPCAVRFQTSGSTGNLNIVAAAREDGLMK